MSGGKPGGRSPLGVEIQHLQALLQHIHWVRTFIFVLIIVTILWIWGSG